MFGSHEIREEIVREEGRDFRGTGDRVKQYREEDRQEGERKTREPTLKVNYS